MFRDNHFSGGDETYDQTNSFGDRCSKKVI